MSEIELMVFLIRARRYQGIHAHCRGQDGQLVGFCWTRLDVPWQGPRLWWVNPINLRLLRAFLFRIRRRRKHRRQRQRRQNFSFCRRLEATEASVWRSRTIRRWPRHKERWVTFHLEGRVGCDGRWAEKLIAVLKGKAGDGQNPGQQQYSEAEE